jgi:hypothetical protein
MEQNEGIKAWQWIVTVIVIIILIVLGYYMFKGNTAPVGTDVSPTSSASPTDLNEVNRVVVADQYPGNVVYVSSVQLANPGWVVIHKDENGKPGKVIGSTYFDKGINPGKITLTENTADGSIYYAMLHADDGDKKFDATKDAEIKDSRGTVISKIFRATSSITEVKG